MRDSDSVSSPLEHKVLRRDIWIHTVLLILTLGLYSFADLFVSCREMNAHLVEQWAYEEELMRRIIEFEGGIGIETYGEDRGGSLGSLATSCESEPCRSDRVAGWQLGAE